MPFWKKSEDPWDIDPKKKRREASVSFFERETPPESEVPAGPEPSAKPEAPVEQAAPVNCPWCGKKMEKGCLHTPEGRIYWQSEPPKAFGFKDYADDALVVDDETGGWLYYKTAYYCRDCQKMTMDTTGIEQPLALQKNSFSEYVDQWNALMEKEKEQKKNKEV